MFTCIWQLWDWLESPPLFNTTMENKKLQQFQQANLAPQKKLLSSMTYQQQQQQQQQLSQKPPISSATLEEYHRMNMLTNLQQNQYKNMTLNMDDNNHKNYDTTSSGSPLTPIDSPPQPLDHHNLMAKSISYQNNYQQQQMMLQATNNRNKYGPEQLYQTPREARAYHIKATNSNNNRTTTTAHNTNLDLNNPVTALQQQYQQLQQAKMQAQIQTQNDALVQQQRTFALRQAFNPPANNQHYAHSMIGSPSTLSDFQHEQSNSIHNSMIQQSNRNIPPSTLNISSQYQTAAAAESPLKQQNIYEQKSKLQNLYHQPNSQYNRYSQQEINILLQQQYNNLNVKAKLEGQTIGNSGIPGDPSPVYIQQNHPGHVVNQACQTQISGGAGGKHPPNVIAIDHKTPSTSTEETSSVKSPTHPPAERKKSFGTIQALRSPITKRPASSPVTLSGWLYKQGSDGLKVWRKRWFVLSEYCLYYYKGPEEEKLLGSILLPSYKVSACLPEDKIYRKFAFKCEHTNMRTYWLAAENSEQMYLWVRAMMAATLMQASSESDQTSQPSSSSINHSGENSDSGIHTFQSQHGKLPHGPVTPASDMGGMQPLYANAPPKPRRITDGGYSSPSPEILIDRPENNLNHQGRVLMSPALQQRSHQAIYDTRTGSVTSKLRIDNSPDHRMMQMQYEKQDMNYETKKHMPRHSMPGADSLMRNEYVKSPSMQHMMQSRYNSGLDLEHQQAHSQKQLLEDIYGDKKLYGQRPLHVKPQNSMSQSQGSVMTYPNVERRTPDAYGRSSNRFQGRYFSDYEDIYNIGKAEHVQSIPADLGYRRPLSPPTYNNQKVIPPMPARYTPNHLESNALNKYLQSPGITRPHSADFLEYEVRAEAAATDLKAKTKRAPRPKSSLDINRGPDSYYYSEESYAEKMRQSALYLQKPHQLSASVTNTLSPQLGSSTTMPASYNHSRNSEFTQYTSGGDMSSSGYENPYGRTTKETEILNEAIMNKASLSDTRINRPTIASAATAAATGSSASSLLLAKDYQLRLQQNEQFLRSASARLPKTFDTNNSNNDIHSPTSSAHFSVKDGERKREESMKRLLEWKQRMLQSPLTRKGVQQNGSPSIMKLGSNPNILSSHGAIQKTRSTDIHTNAGYNSYSSDDEVSVSFRNMHNLQHGNNLTVKPEALIDHHSRSHSSRGHPNLSNSYYSMTFPDHQHKFMDEIENKNYYPMRKTGSRVEIDLLEKETSTQIRNLDMSAGDLLSRTHEELVLLLIQLRRENSQTARAIEQCCTEIHDAQNSIRTTEGLTRAESIQRLDYLKQHLLDLEKQYEKSKPLVNLVDNMVKLGSLYRNNENSNNRRKSQELEAATLERLDFNQRIQERRLYEEEQKRWDRLSPNQNELQSKVNQLYYLDQLLQEESGTLQILQRDKENLERALTNLRARLQVSNDPPVVLEAAKKQQMILERELSRVHQLLADNSKKLEQTVAGNAQLEEELLILRQKLQTSKGSRGSQSALAQTPNTNNPGDSIQYASSTAVLLESELRRVQQLVGDMQRQRLELSEAVTQLTANSDRLYQEIGNRESAKKSKSSSNLNKRSNSSCWTETDLDSMKSIDHTSSFSTDCGNLSVPLYVDTNSGFQPVIHGGSVVHKVIPYDNKNQHNYGYEDIGVSDNNGGECDDLMETNPFANLSNQEKQEIKTVRIVKRESERRHRDRERTSGQGTGSISSSQNLEPEDSNAQNYVEDLYSRSKSLPRTPTTEVPYNQNSNFTEKHENLMMDDNAQAFPSNLLKKSTGSTRHSHGNLEQLPIQSVKYPDYYSLTSKNSRNPYPITMTDKNRNFSSSDMIPFNNDNKIVGRVNVVDKKQPTSFALRNKTGSIQSLTKDMDPVFQSEAARQIINEMSGSASEDNAATDKVPSAQKQKRAVPREKRRHFTTPNNVNQKAMQKVNSENDMNKNNTNWRARDDLDMEVALRPRINAPDVVRSALGQGEKISENTIDRLFGAPNKILIPERYIPEKAPELSTEEKKRRQEKVEAIKKMLSDAPMNSANDAGGNQPATKITAEKKQREHLLQLNQILAQQVMQMSKVVAEKAMSTLPSERSDLNNLLTPEDNYDDDDADALSPTTNNPLPRYQQRNNFFT